MATQKPTAQDTYEDLRLDQQLCFRLYSTSRDIVRRYKPLLDPLGLTYPQYLVMLVLWEHGTLSVKSLGERLQLDSGTLTPMLKKLEARGNVTRTRSKEDERMVEVSLTQAGQDLREKARDIPTCLFESLGVDARLAQRLMSTLDEFNAQVSARSSH